MFRQVPGDEDRGDRDMFEDVQCAPAVTRRHRGKIASVEGGEFDEPLDFVLEGIADRGCFRHRTSTRALTEACQTWCMMRRSRSGRALTEVIAATVAVSGAVASLGGDFGRAEGLSIAGWQTLSALGNDELTVPQIADRLGRRRQTTQHAVDVMLEQGFVIQVPNPANRRSPLIATTDQGESVFFAALQRQTEWSNSVSERFDLDDLAATTRVLQQLGREIDR